MKVATKIQFENIEKEKKLYELESSVILQRINEDSSLLTIRDEDYYLLIHNIIRLKKNDIFFAIKDLYDLQSILTLDGSNLLFFSINHNNQEIALYLSDIIDINQRNKNGNLPLHLAVQADMIELVNKLLDMGADINDCGGNWKSSPIRIACKKFNKEMIDLLLDRGADPKLIETRGSSFRNFSLILRIRKEKEKKAKIKEKKEKQAIAKQEKEQLKLEKREKKKQAKLQKLIAQGKVDEDGNKITRKRDKQKEDNPPQVIELIDKDFWKNN